MNKKNVRAIIPALHILLTFILERLIFSFSWDNLEFKTSIARTDYFISDKAEMIITYILSKLVAVIIILLVWKLVFCLIDRKISKEIIRLFGIIYLVGLLVGVFLYPAIFGLEVDNYANYALAVRFLPTYWHSIFTGAVYAGCMMVIPHPIAIFLVQWSCFVATIAFIYKGVNDITGGSKAKYGSLLFFVMPWTYEVVCDAYRNDYYTILCLFYFSFIFFAFKSGKGLNRQQIVIAALLSAFVMVWRSEGLFVGFGGFIFLLLFCAKTDKKNIIKAVVVMLCSFILLHSIQGIGTKKYYGKDYVLINSTGVLNNIFNDPYADLSYEGADEDLGNIEAVIPVQILKESGISGYRDYNFTNGIPDANQTLASDEVASAYMKSYYRIVLHNIKDYVKRQLSCMCYAMQLNVSPTTYTYTDGVYTELDSFVYEQRELGKEEFLNTPFTSAWEQNNFRRLVSNMIMPLILKWQGFVGLNILLSSLAILGIIRLFIHEIAEAFKNRQLRNAYLFMSLIILAELCAIAAFIPEGRPYYLFPMLYSCYLTIYFATLRGE
ncbi:MAG: hypothetical protein J6P79_09985 [Pseudobutyrivibrio sp.]|nr:hypothetical protein [Pseudobutyrivibrio sp.]